MGKKSLSKVVGTVVLTVAVVSSSSVTASATPAPEETVAQLIDRVAPNQGEVVSPAQEAALSVADASSAPPIEVPADKGPSLEVAMPSNVSVGGGTITDDGTVVYLSTDGGADVAVQTMSDGAVRAQTIINDPANPHEFGYTMGDSYQPAKDANGDIWIVGFDEVGALQTFKVEEAWAMDAEGDAVSTHYEIRGVELVQVVEPEPDATYPIVADPTWQWYAGGYGAGLSKAETRNVASAGSVTGFCALVPGALRIACSVAGAYWFLQANLARNANGCVFYVAAPGPLAMRWLSPECR